MSFESDDRGIALDPTTQFFSATCYLPHSKEGHASQGEKLRALRERGIVAERLRSLVHRHRTYAVTPTVLRQHEMLEVLPTADRSELLGLEEGTRRAGLRLAASCADVENAFERIGVPSRILKGPPLSRFLYGDVGLRHSKDIDAWIPPSGIREAVKLLTSLGYSMKEGHGAIWRHMGATGLSCLEELPLVHARMGAMDLRWRIERSARSGYEKVWQDLLENRPMGVGHFLFLIWHGAQHRWCRLKWLGDIRAWLDRDGEIMRRSLEAAHRLGLARCLFQTQLLLERYFGFGGTQESRDPRSTKMANLAQSSIECAEEPADFGSREGLVSTLAYESLLHRRYPLAERAQVFARLGISVTRRALFPLA